MADALNVWPGLSLPRKLVTEVATILATRGAGKSYGSASIIEELYASALQFVVIDPMGVYWGLRSGADGGRRGGLPIVVLGGEQGDLPLEPTSGLLIANTVVDSGHSFVLDLSAFDTKADQVRFVQAFAERLFTAKAPMEKRTTLLVVVDEADEFAPQRPAADETKMLAAMIRLAKRGRSRGIGLLSITQRSAEFAKAVLDLSSLVVFMRTAGPRDRKVIRDWLAGHDPSLVKLADTTLPKLDTGDAVVYSPHLLGLDEPQRVHFRRIRTFDSYKTPEAGEAKAVPKAKIEIDLDTLGAEMVATRERARENDPKVLKDKIRELEERLQRGGGKPEIKIQHIEVEKPVKVSVLTAADRQTLERIEKQITERSERMRALAEREMGPLRRIVAKIDETIAREAARPAPRPPAEPARRAADPPRPTGAPSSNGSIGTSARNFLTTLVRYYPTPLSIAQLGVLTRRKTRGGQWNTAWKELREGGYVSYDGGLATVTEKGIAESGAVIGTPQTAEEVIEMWRGALPTSARAIFDVLAAERGRLVEIEEIGRRLDRATRGGQWNTAVKMLVDANLVVRHTGALAASPHLFP